MGIFDPKNTAQPDLHGKSLSEDERRRAIHRIESDLSLLYSDRLKLVRQKSERDLGLRKLRDQFRKIQMEIEEDELKAKKEASALQTLEEDIRFTKKRLTAL